MKTLKNKLKPNRSFVSEIDEFLATFDKRHPEKSASQAQQIEQYQALITKRDIKKTDL